MQCSRNRRWQQVQSLLKYRGQRPASLFVSGFYLADGCRNNEKLTQLKLVRIGYPTEEMIANDNLGGRWLFLELTRSPQGEGLRWTFCAPLDVKHYLLPFSDTKPLRPGAYKEDATYIWLGMFLSSLVKQAISEALMEGNFLRESETVSLELASETRSIMLGARRRGHHRGPMILKNWPCM